MAVNRTKIWHQLGLKRAFPFDEFSYQLSYQLQRFLISVYVAFM
jgi:hypothetical protein